MARANSNGFSRNESNPQKKRKLQQMQENNDVYLVLEESLIDKNFQDALSAEFYNHDSPAEFDANQEIAKFPYIPMTTPLAGLIQWIRSESLPDNLVLYESIISFLLPVTAVIVPNEEFLQKVIATTDGIDFPTLDEYIRKYFTKVNQFSGVMEDMKFIFIFLDLGKEINKLQRKVRCYAILFFFISCSQPFPLVFHFQTTDRSIPLLLDQAYVHMMFEHNIEVFQAKKHCDLTEYLHNITRTLHSKVEKNTSIFSLVMKYVVNISQFIWFLISDIFYYFFLPELLEPKLMKTWTNRRKKNSK
jgi:hypothetical protein